MSSQNSTTDKPLYLWTEDGITRVEVIVDDRSMIGVWTTGREPRLVFEVYDSTADDLVRELQVARQRYFAIRLEEKPIEVGIDPETGLLTASQGYVRMRRFIVGETFSTMVGDTHRDGLVFLRAPRNPEPSWHRREIRLWPVWKREAYMRLLEALTAAERGAEAPVSA
jgi:hypothetical protein